ncbi:MAG: hypothetical protein WC523_00055 [Patescibacteria group bacterium]
MTNNNTVNPWPALSQWPLTQTTTNSNGTGGHATAYYGNTQVGGCIGQTDGYGYYYVTVGASGTTLNNNSYTVFTDSDSFRVMKLPLNRIPKSVYVDGKKRILGILGTNAECFYTGEHLIFTTKLFGFWDSSHDTIILEYPNATYNYKYTNDGQRQLKTKLISIIK